MTKDSIDGLDYRIAKIDLKPEDILVVKFNVAALSPEMVNKIRESLTRQLGPKVRTLVIDNSVDLSIIATESVGGTVRP